MNGFDLFRDDGGGGVGQVHDKKERFGGVWWWWWWNGTSPQRSYLYSLYSIVVVVLVVVGLAGRKSFFFFFVDLLLPVNPYWINKKSEINKASRPPAVPLTDALLLCAAAATRVHGNEPIVFDILTNISLTNANKSTSTSTKC